MKEYAFGIDLGGTTAKVGLFTTSGALLEKWEVPTDTSNAGEHILENLADAIHAKMAEKEITSEQVEGVGIGVPGPVLDSRVVPIICANLGGWGERNVSAQLSGLLDGMKVLVGNDANVAALGEIWMGTAKGCRSAVMVTLGTGVGGGVIVNGKVIDGAHGAGGEIGHITVNPHETAACGCGKHGCLEQYSSATGVVRCMKKLLDENPDADCVLRGKDFEAKDVFDAARSGDALAAREVDEMTDTLGMALASIASTTDPEMFLIGGGVARAGDVLFDPLVEHFKTFAFAVHALDPDGQVAAAEALGRVRHLLDGVGELMHHHLGEDAGHQQHQTGREEEVREELPAELHQPVARRAEEEVAGTLAALSAHLTHRDVALLGQYAVQRAEDVIILLGLGRLLQHGRLHHIPGQIVRV